MDLATQGQRRLSVAAVVTAGLLAGLIGGALILTHGSDPAAAAGSQDIRFLGSNLVKQDASPGGNRTILLSLNGGALQHRAVCTDLGGGVVRLQVQIRSDKNGGVALSRNGSQVLSDAFVNFWTATAGATHGFAESYDVLYKDGTYRHFELSFAVKHGRDCVSHIVATTA